MRVTLLEHIETIMQGYEAGLRQAERIGDFHIPNKDKEIQSFYADLTRGIIDKGVTIPFTYPSVKLCISDVLLR